MSKTLLKRNESWKAGCGEGGIRLESTGYRENGVVYLLESGEKFDMSS